MVVLEADLFSMTHQGGATGAVMGGARPFWWCETPINLPFGCVKYQ
jgi:hypothetical protein